MRFDLLFDLVAWVARAVLTMFPAVEDKYVAVALLPDRRWYLEEVRPWDAPAS